MGVMRKDNGNGGCGEGRCRKGGCGRLLGMECVEREGEGRWLVQVEGNDSKQLEMKFLCKQLITDCNAATNSTENAVRIY